MDYVLKNTDITYKIDSTYIIPYGESLENPVSVTGKVSNITAFQIIRASVVVKILKCTGTVRIWTELSRFWFPRRCSSTGGQFLGYEPVTVSVGSQTSFDVTLHGDFPKSKASVHCLGIGLSGKALSYNVQQVKAGDITTVRTPNHQFALTGKVAGVTINASSSGVGGASRE